MIRFKEFLVEKKEYSSEWLEDTHPKFIRLLMNKYGWREKSNFISKKNNHHILSFSKGNQDPKYGDQHLIDIHLIPAYFADSSVRSRKHRQNRWERGIEHKHIPYGQFYRHEWQHYKDYGRDYEAKGQGIESLLKHVREHDQRTKTFQSKKQTWDNEMERRKGTGEQIYPFPIKESKKWLARIMEKYV
jgi:hypothetical protein